MKRLIRRCAQCRTLNHRALLLRVRLGEGGAPVCDAAPGRSIYLCLHPHCLQRAAGNKGLQRLLPGLDPLSWRSFCQQTLSRMGAPLRPGRR